MNFLKNKHKNLYFVFLLQFAFIVTRFIGFKSPLLTHDHGNHLLIAKYISEGKIPYKEFSLSHMPGLYFFLVPGFLISDSLFWPMLFNFLIASLVIPLFYLLLEQFFRKSYLVWIGLIILFTDPLLTIYSKVTTYDCFFLPFLLIGILILQKEKLKKKDYWILSGIFLLSFLIKITTVFFFGFYLLASFLVYFSQKKKLSQTIKVAFVLILTLGVIFLVLSFLIPEMFKDIFSSHLLRSKMSIKERIKNLLESFKFSPINLLFSFVLSPFLIFSEKNKKELVFSLFFLLFLLFSFLVPQHFYRHHLIMIIPVGTILFVWLVMDLVDFLKSRSEKWLKFISIVGSLPFTMHFFFWFMGLTYTSFDTGKIYQKVKNMEGNLFANSNYYYMITQKEPHFWYYVTIPDSPCRWAGLCHKHREILANADIAMVDLSTIRRHIFDESFYDDLNSKFYLEDYDPRTGLMLYLRR